MLNPANVVGIDQDWIFTTGVLVYSSPAVVKGVVYVGTIYGNVCALDAATGAEQWNYTTGGTVAQPTATCTR